MLVITLRMMLVTRIWTRRMVMMEIMRRLL